MIETNDDIRLGTDFPDHPKTRRLARRLGEGAPWALVRLWIWVSKRRPDGRLTDLEPEDIAEAARWEGPADDFVKTLLASRWLDLEDGVLVCHEWEKHQPYVCGRAARIERARAAANRRWEVEKKQPEPVQAFGQGPTLFDPEPGESSAHAAGNRGASGRDAGTVLPSLPVPSPNPNPTRARQALPSATGGGVDGDPDPAGLDTSEGGKQRAFQRRLELLARMETVPHLKHLAPLVESMTPIGVYADTGKAAFHGPAAARGVLKFALRTQLGEDWAGSVVVFTRGVPPPRGMG